MNQTVRYIIFIALSMAIITIWSSIYAPKPRPKGAHPNAPDAGARVQGEQKAPVPAPPPTVAPTPPPTAGEPELVAGPSEEVRTALWTAKFSTKGAGLESFVLTGAKQTQRTAHGEPGAGMDLAHPGPGQPLPLSVDLSALPGGFGPDAVYQAEPQKSGVQELVFKRTRVGITVTKRFSWTLNSYALRMEVSVSGAPAGHNVPVKVFYTASEPPTTGGGFFSFKARVEPHASVCLLANERSMTSEAFTGGKMLRQLEGSPVFAGIDEKYFIAAMAPGSDPAPSTCSIGNGPTPDDHQAILDRTMTVGANGAASTSLDLYIGPKADDHLKAFDHSLTKSINYGYGGFLNLICDALLWLLKVFHIVVRNWGVAIIVLTIVMKAITLPLTHKQMVSMEEGKRLNPLVEKIKQKYAGDQARINMETMKLYKEHNYQPLAGCFPMLIQTPVWFALYSALGASFELYKEPFIRGWINDLTQRDPTFILPIALTLTMVLNQKLTPQAAPANEQAAQMQKMMYAMPVVFGFIMMSLPAGLVLYSFTSTLLGIGQSLYFRKRFGLTGGGTPAFPM